MVRTFMNYSKVPRVYWEEDNAVMKYSLDFRSGE